MKLAEALQRRADLNRRIRQINSRLESNAVIQEGSEPQEDPAELLAELDRDLDELEDLITRINLTNSKVKVNGETLTSLLARREVMQLRINALRDAADAASRLVDRYRATEIRNVSTMKVAELRKRIDDLSGQFRVLDNAIQAANWATELK